MRFQIRLNRIEDVSQILSTCNPFFNVTTKKTAGETQPLASQIYQTQVQNITGAIPSSQLRSVGPPRSLNIAVPPPACRMQPPSREAMSSKPPQEVPRSGTAGKRKIDSEDGLDDIKRKLMRNYVPPGGSSDRVAQNQGSIVIRVSR